MTTDKVKSLAEARAVKAEDASLWTPADLLRSLLRKVEAGEVKTEKMVVLWLEEPAEGLASAYAGVDRLETLVILGIAQHAAVHHWTDSQT